jgi:HSP20 family protein
MMAVRFRPFGEDLSRDLTDIQTQMNRLFGPVERVWAPPADMHETQNEAVIAVELPGLSEKDIRLSIADDVLTLQGEKQRVEVQDATQYRQERWFGKFERAFSLPFPVETGQVKATFRDGVLTVKLPKAEEVKPKEIKIEAA